MLHYYGEMIEGLLQIAFLPRDLAKLEIRIDLGIVYFKRFIQMFDRLCFLPPL